MADLAARPAAGSLGPRLAEHSTDQLASPAEHWLKKLEIENVGNKIAVIENLGVTENQFDSIDLSDNAIVRLEGFPRLLRLKQLLLNNNRVTRMAKNVHEAIANLETLILTNNKLSNLQDLDPLGDFSKLTMLSLIGNPVVTKANYRLYVISKCKKLKILDFKKVKQKEREAAEKMFPTEEAAAQHGAKTFEPNEDFEAAQAEAKEAAGSAENAAAASAEKPKSGPTPEQLVAIKAAIANATTMEEIARLEEALTSGHLPSQFQVDGQQQQGQEVAADANGKPDSMEVG